MRTVLLLMLLFVPEASAHRPSTAEAVTTIDDPTVSWVVNGELHDGDEVFRVKLDFPRPFALPFELMTERRAGAADFRPAVAIVGPGLPSASAEVAAIIIT